jgi:sRNA-binding carbon storage regulator CsrA
MRARLDSADRRNDFLGNRDLMLGVARLKDQSMMVGDNVMLTVAEIAADRVQLVVSHRSGDRITLWEELSRQWIDDKGTFLLAVGVSVTVWIMGDRVRLGFEAPREMTPHRKEIYDAIHPCRVSR